MTFGSSGAQASWLGIVLAGALLLAPGCGRESGGDDNKGRAYVRDLRNPRPETRIGAAMELGKMRYEPAVDALIRRIADSRQDVRCAVIEALGLIGDRKAVEPLIACLRAEDWSVRKAAAVALGRIRDPAPIPLLLALLDDSRGVVGAAATTALAQIGPPAVEPLLGVFAHTNVVVRQSVAIALGQIADPRAVAPLRLATKDREPAVRIAAVRAVGRARDAESVVLLARMLRDVHAEVRREVESALAEMGEDAVGPLLDLAADANDSARRGAVNLLAKIGSLDAAPALVNALADRDGDVRRSARSFVEARLTVEQVLTPLFAGLKHANPDYRYQCLDVLATIADDRLLDPAIAMLDDATPRIQARAAAVLGAIENPKAGDRLAKLLASGDAAVRHAAATALVALKDPRANEALLQALAAETAPGRDRHDRGRLISAVRALGNVKEPRAVEPLLSLLKHADSEVTEAAVVALGQLGDERAGPPLLDMLKAALGGRRHAVRDPLMEALGRLRYRPAVDTLTPLITSHDLRLAFAAADALGLLGAPESFDTVLRRLQNPTSDDLHERWGRISFTRALSRIDPRRAVEPLVKTLADEPRHNLTQLRHFCGLLAEIGDPRGVRPIADLLLADIPETRLDAITALKRMGDAAIAEMIRLLREPNLGLRSALAVVLADMGPGAVEPLVAALHDESLNVRQGACWALGQTRSDRAVVPLLAQLKHPNSSIRGAAAWALGEIKDPRAVEPLIALLTDPAVAARGGAADALGVLGDKRAADPLLQRVGDADWVARKSVLIALARLGDERVVVHLNEAADGQNPTLKVAAQYARQLLRTNAVPTTAATPSAGGSAVTNRGWTKLPGGGRR